METYQALRARHQKAFNEFPIGFCFGQKQFEEMMAKWGLTPDDTDKIVHIGSGAYLRKCDREDYLTMINGMDEDLKAAIADPATGEKFTIGMFEYELANHEYCITCDDEDAIEACGFNVNEVYEDEYLHHCLKEAKKRYWEHVE